MALLVIVLVALTIGFGGGWVSSTRWNNYAHQSETIKAQDKAIKIVAARTEVTIKADVVAVAEKVKIVTVFKDRVVYRTKEVPVEVIKQMDSGCVVPKHFVSLWNSANKGLVPDAPSRVDVAPSGVKLSDISSQKDVETEICLTNTQRLKGLQHWITEQKAVN